jgi:hypothetical protein
MLFTPLRKAVIAGAGVLAVGAAAGVSVHSATSATLTASTSPSASTPTTSPRADVPDGRECHRGPALGAGKQVLSIAASVTKQTEQQILDQLRAGKTLNEIAGSNAATVEQQALDQLKANLDKKVAAGKLDATREKTMLDKARAALDKAMAANLSSKIPAAGTVCLPGGLFGTVVKVTAQKTGLTEQQVLDQLKAGKSIDDIAGGKAADIKATVLQMEQQKAASQLDTIMGHAGLPTPHQGGGKTHGGGAAPSPAPSPSGS